MYTVFNGKNEFAWFQMPCVGPCVEGLCGRCVGLVWALCGPPCIYCHRHVLIVFYKRLRYHAAMFYSSGSEKAAFTLRLDTMKTIRKTCFSYEILIFLMGP